MKHIYFHIDELGRDAITASSLKREFGKKGIVLHYGNRYITSFLLKRNLRAFDLLILPRPMFLTKFRDVDLKKRPPVLVLYTEAAGRVVDKRNDPFTLFSLLDRTYMEGDPRLVNKVSKFLLWGETGLKRIRQYYPDLVSKFVITGHPRHDVKCLPKKVKVQGQDKLKVGIISRQPLLNDYLGRSPLSNVIHFSMMEKKYNYFNKVTGENLPAQHISPMDELYIEASDINNIVKLIKALSDKGYEVHLKIHPRENRLSWASFIERHKLNVTLAFWCMPFSHWASKLDYVVGPASTSFYDCLALGVKPICISNLDKNRKAHLNESSEEYIELMKYVEHPGSLDELFELLTPSNREVSLTDDMLALLKEETDFPDSNNSSARILEVCEKEMTLSHVPSKYWKRISYQVLSKVMSFILVLLEKIRSRPGQGSSFSMTPAKIKYIDSLTKDD